MGDENDTAIQQWQDQEARHSLLRLMKISNEFDMIKNSMEMFPLPGNRVEPQTGDSFGFRHQPNAREIGGGMRATDLLTSLSLSTDTTKLEIQELAENAKDQLTKMLMEGEPLWQHDVTKGFEVLNKVEYVKKFDTNLEMTLEDIVKIIAVDAPIDLPDLDGAPTDITHKPVSEEGLVMQNESVNQLGSSAVKVGQASRYMGFVQMPPICLVEALMDVRLWSFMFSEMLSRAVVLGILSPGAQGTHDGALLVMTSEYHAPSPLLPTWQSCFARHCKEISPSVWVIVDVSLESMINNPLMNCKRRPSGCLIQGLLDGNTTQITWIEHTVAELTSVHPLLKSVVESNALFSAKQWVDTVTQQCQRLNHTMQQSPFDLNKEVSSFQLEALLRLASRMRREFYGAMSASTKGNAYKTMNIDGGDDILLMTLEGNEQGPSIFIVRTSAWFPFKSKHIFGFLGNDKNRTKWDMLALEHQTEELFHVHSSENPADIVSIKKLVDKKGRVDTFFLQDKHETDAALYIIMSPITYDSVASLSSHGNIDEIPLLPSGFAILSNEQSSQQGSLVTISFQLLDGSSRGQSLSPSATLKLYNLVIETISLVRAGLFNANPDDIEGCSCVRRSKQPEQTQGASGINMINDVDNGNSGSYTVHVAD